METRNPGKISGVSDHRGAAVTQRSVPHRPRRHGGYLYEASVRGRSAPGNVCRDVPGDAHAGWECGPLIKGF